MISLVGNSRFRPASKHGLPCVAFTRSESFAMTAFKNLPPWEDFANGSKSDMLRMRQEFLRIIELKQRRTLAEHSVMKTEDQEETARDNWRQQQVKRCRHNASVMKCAAC